MHGLHVSDHSVTPVTCGAEIENRPSIDPDVAFPYDGIYLSASFEIVRPPGSRGKARIGHATSDLKPLRHCQ